ncbi:MAG: alcohol dehydrogenase, partial [Bacteroidaceae bacterium]|nr:alcohol dehydrogenase [Bacteroidaceae bacterium]
MQPTLISWNGKRQIVGATCNYYYGVNPDNGEIEWTATGWYPNARWENICPNGPVFKDGILVFSQGYGINTTAFKLADDLKSVSVAWKNDDLSTHHGGYVLVDGVVYGSNWV